MIGSPKFFFRPSGACSFLRPPHGSRRGLPSGAPPVLPLGAGKLLKQLADDARTDTGLKPGANESRQTSARNAALALVVCAVVILKIKVRSGSTFFPAANLMSGATKF